mmetsp:Transcript_149/g.468  ORF Transcript_149/g.468 Transcript_149/m.468 type:complete len:203 (+) Transcript_149:549-1157(+)
MVMTKGEGRDGVVQVRIDGVHAEYRLVPRRVQVSLRLIPHGPGRKVPIVDRVAWYHALLPVVALRTKVLPCILAENGQRSVVDGGWKGLLASSAQTSLDSQLLGHAMMLSRWAHDEAHVSAAGLYSLMLLGGLLLGVRVLVLFGCDGELRVFQLRGKKGLHYRHMVRMENARGEALYAGLQQLPPVLYHCTIALPEHLLSVR